jgi:hypothetical protein
VVCNAVRVRRMASRRTSRRALSQKRARKMARTHFEFKVKRKRRTLRSAWDKLVQETEIYAHLIPISRARRILGEAMPNSFESIERDSALVFVLNRELRIIYCNEAWDRFAQSNGGTALMRPIPYGMCVLDVIPEPLKTPYRAAYLKVFATTRQWVHEYECSSSTVYRLFQATALQRPEDDLILVANFLLEQRPHGDERPIMPPDPAAYEGSDHSVALCSVCRKTRRRRGRRWHWVPAYTGGPSGTRGV